LRLPHLCVSAELRRVGLVELKSLARSNDEAVMFSRPSIDVLFETAAEARWTGSGCRRAYRCQQRRIRGAEVHSLGWWMGLIQKPAGIRVDYAAISHR
jgi:hypothetical protein